MKKLRVAYCGTPDFSVPTLELLANHPNIEITHVITMPDRPAGRGQKLQSPPVAEYAKSNKIKLIQTENINKEKKALEELEKENLDAIIVLAFAQFLGSKILNLPKLGCFNIHTSLLPKYRGAAPIQYALLNGDNETGVSIQRMVKEMDAGDLVLSHPLKVNENESGGQLYTRLKFQAALSMNNLIHTILEDKLIATPQEHEKASFAPTLKKEDGLIDFTNSSTKKIHDQMRALSPWPGTYCFLGNKRLKVFSFQRELTKLSPGETSTQMGTLVVGTQDGAIRLTEVQLEGKKKCSDTDLINGLKNSKADLTLRSSKA